MNLDYPKQHNTLINKNYTKKIINKAYQIMVLRKYYMIQKYQDHINHIQQHMI